MTETGPTFVHSSAVLAGDVLIAEGASIWPYAVIRAERQYVRIGAFANLQDHAMIHIGWDYPTVVGDYSSIGHRATLHGCTIEPACLVGIGATIMEGCIIGRGSIIAAHSFLPSGMIVPPNSLVLGTPARVIRRTDALKSNVIDALLYHDNAIAFASGDHRAWEDIDRAALALRADEIIATL